MNGGLATETPPTWENRHGPTGGGNTDRAANRSRLRREGSGVKPTYWNDRLSPNGGN